MTCHTHGRREQTLADIMTPEELGAAFDRLDAWRERTIAEIKAEECRCRCPWPEYGHGKPGFGTCSRCLTLFRFNVRCCNENGPIRPSL